MTRLATVPGVVLVSVAATMWGLDGLIRKPLAQSTTPTTIVFGEHVVLVALTLPLLVPALRALWRAGPAYIAAGIAVGAGASAIATILFTKALFRGDFITVVVLQKAQPLIAVFGAWLLLGEQPRPRFAWFLLPALAGIWLVALPHPLDPHARGLTPIVETLSAAALWGMGTVLVRFLSRRLPFEQVTTVRFAFGQKLRGRRVNGRCVGQTKRNRSRPACTRTVTRGRLSFSGHSGLNKVFFQGRLPSRKKLRPGRYTLVVTASNASGRSSPKRLSFTIVR